MVTEVVNAAAALTLLRDASEYAGLVLAYSPGDLKAARRALGKLDDASRAWESTCTALLVTTPESERGSVEHLQFVAIGDQMQACVNDGIQSLRELIAARERATR